LTTNTQYEIETVNNRNFHKKRVEQYRRVGVDVVVIATNKLPVDINKRIKVIKQYIRPD
jgi:S-methylmethionine-dependent homocysteine/selenocysteine methylase